MLRLSEVMMAKEKSGIAILREIALVRQSLVRPELKAKMIAELEALLEAVYGAKPVVTDEKLKQAK